MTTRRFDLIKRRPDEMTMIEQVMVPGRVLCCQGWSRPYLAVLTEVKGGYAHIFAYRPATKKTPGHWEQGARHLRLLLPKDILYATPFVLTEPYPDQLPPELVEWATDAGAFKRPWTGPMPVIIAGDLHRSLKAAAAARGVKPGSLAEELIRKGLET